jgi:hypothetical protein
VTAAFGKWLGFVLMMTAMLVVSAIGVATVVVAAKSAAPTRYGQFIPALRVSDDRWRTVGKDPGHRREVANVSVDGP